MTAASLPRMRGHDGLWRYVDPSIVVLPAAITSIGLLMIYSATRTNPATGPTYFVERQGAAIAIGLVLMAVAAMFDERRLREISGVAYLGLLTLLVGVLVVGQTVNGAKAWFQFGAIQLQPAEFGKPIVILVLASYFTHDRALDGVPLSLSRLLSAVMIVALPMALILLQPDLGTVLVFTVISAVMIFVAGAKMRHIVLLVVLMVLGVGAVLASDTLEDYQKDRLTVFLNPAERDIKEAYNLTQAQVAISNGGIEGAGLFRGTQTRGRFVPAQQTDFIFTVIGEELGFIGGATVIGLFMLLFLRLWRIAAVAREPFGALLTVGVLAMLAFQVFQSIGMTMGIVPITGIPLPFVSYGGSSIITSFTSLGLVIGAHMRRFT